MKPFQPRRGQAEERRLTREREPEVAEGKEQKGLFLEEPDPRFRFLGTDWRQRHLLTSPQHRRKQRLLGWWCTRRVAVVQLQRRHSFKKGGDASPVRQATLLLSTATVHGSSSEACKTRLAKGSSQKSSAWGREIPREASLLLVGRAGRGKEPSECPS